MAESKENYVKVPHWLMDYLKTADLNMTQFRILHAVIRHTFGYHKTWNQFSLAFLSEQTGCNKRQVTRELGKLIEQNILTERYDEDGRRLLKISASLKNDKGSDSLDTTGSDSLDTRSSDSSVTHIKKEIKKDSKERIYITLTSDDHQYIKIYLKQFEKVMKKKHPRVSAANYAFIENQIDHLISFDIDEAAWEEQVKYHLNNLPKNNNGSILPFLKASHRYFEVGVYDQF
ncbi:replication protein [Paenibacillus sp. FSL R5-0527]|uniref:replication protein n=1 Tax=Paenibacillus sp. FSL R5-0527 TaxID=2975321 RepID=UPI00097ABFFA|nr:hypothetical protein BK140_10965 [Paenibacillus macerans]